jgi:lipid II:glycine glycyltransferase (peptidoglycan interpeptide bridge formation enzyme)
MVSDPHPAMLNRVGAGQAAGISTDAPAAAWDAFLERTPLGQFQQTSRWARVKALDGWKAERVWLDPRRPDAGGLQLLWKPTRLGNMGYVSKGPVLPNEDQSAVNALLTELQSTAARLGLRALILQPPDQSAITPSDLHRHGFGTKPLDSVIRATAVIDVSAGRAALLARMNRQVRREARLAAERGVTVRQGGREDLACFFALMELSCRRQQTAPNPARVELLEALWDEFSPNIILGLAAVHGEPVAGLLMLGHGSRLSFWKKGWDSKDRHSFANCLLNVEAIGWAHDRGYQTVDFVGLDPQIAETLATGGQLTESQLRSRHMFNLRLGAEPKLLPPARLLVVNPVVRQLYHLGSRCRPINNWLQRRLGAG